MTGRARGLLLALFVFYVAALAAVLLGPSSRPGTDAIASSYAFLTRLGVPPEVMTPDRLEVLLNVAILAPLPMLGSLVWTSLTWRDWTAYGFVLSLAAETWQALTFAERGATFSDVVANTTGVLLGALAATGLRWLMRERSSPPREG